MARCSSSIIAVVILVHVVSPYIAVYRNVTLTVCVYVLNEVVKIEFLLVDFVGKKCLCYLMCYKNTKLQPVIRGQKGYTHKYIIDKLQNICSSVRDQ
jgi:hypothetical protein